MDLWGQTTVFAKAEKHGIRIYDIEIVCRNHNMNFQNLSSTTTINCSISQLTDQI